MVAGAASPVPAAGASASTLGGSIVDVPSRQAPRWRRETSCSAPTSSWLWRGSWPATAASPATPTCSTCASTWPGAPNTGWRCSGRVAPTSSVSPAISSPGAGRGPRSPAACTVACFYRYAEQEGLIAISPAAHVRRPRLDYESHAPGLDRNEVGAMLVAAGLASARDHALISLLALNGLRVSEAIGTDIEALGLERGHRTLTILRKGGKIATVPLAPRTARAIDLAVGERCDGPMFVGTNGTRIERHAAGCPVERERRPYHQRHASGVRRGAKARRAVMSLRDASTSRPA